MSNTVSEKCGRPFIRAIRPWIILSLLLVRPCQAAVPLQTDTSAQVSEAVSLFPREPKLARKQLIELGPPAFSSILRMIRDDSGLGTIKKTFLIDVIARNKTRESGSALIELLTDSDAYVRGLAVSSLGKRSYRPAVPHLVKMLDDKGVFVTTIKTDPERGEPVLVRDKATEALQTITRMKLGQKDGTADGGRKGESVAAVVAQAACQVNESRSQD